MPSLVATGTVREALEPLLTWIGEHRGTLGVIAGASATIAILYMVLMSLIIARMSADYFLAPAPAPSSWRNRHPFTRVVGRIGKNLLGVIFLLTGIALSVPFIPGQGLLTVLIGICLLDFPGKRRIELRIVRQRHVLRAINWIRARAKQPPLVLPEHE